MKRGCDWPRVFREYAARSRTEPLADYYTSGVPAPETPIGDVPMVALDMETTGLRADRNAIVSIAVVPFRLARIRFSERAYWIVRPPGELSSLSVTFHHITHADIADAPDVGAILPTLLGRMAGRMPVVHYQGIERPFLDAAARARYGEPLVFPVIDTMELEARVHRRSLISRMRRRLTGKRVSIRLADSRTRYGLPSYRGHHAVLDALATAELLQAQVAARFSPRTPLSELWS